jgi:ABC-2 type transport system permease protein
MTTATATPLATTTVAAWPVVFSLAGRELVRFFRQRNRVFGALGQPIIFWLLFSEGLTPSGLDYAHFFPGVLVMILLFTAIFATVSIIEDRREGFLQGVLVSPVPRWAMVLGKVLGGTAIAMLQGVLFLALGWWLVDAVAPTPVELLSAVAFMFAVSLSLTGLGFVLAWRMDSVQGYHAVMSLLLFPMWLLSGAFFPGGGDGWLAWVVRLNPLTYGVAGMRHYLESTAEAANLPSIGVCWLVTLAFAAAMMVASTWIANTRTTGDLL